MNYLLLLRMMNLLRLNLEVVYDDELIQLMDRYMDLRDEGRSWAFGKLVVELREVLLERRVVVMDFLPWICCQRALKTRWLHRQAEMILKWSLE